MFAFGTQTEYVKKKQSSSFFFSSYTFKQLKTIKAGASDIMTYNHATNNNQTNSFSIRIFP